MVWMVQFLVELLVTDSNDAHSVEKKNFSEVCDCKWDCEI